MNKLERIKLIFKDTELDHSIIYFLPGIYPPGEYAMGESGILIPWKATIAFIDLEPKVNWGHACLYIALEEEGSEWKKFTAQFPPHWSDDNLKPEFVWKGALAPDWAIF